MDDNFNFKAAQYANFNNLNDDEENLATYFDQDHERVFQDSNSNNGFGKLRKSISVGNLDIKHFQNSENVLSCSLKKLKIEQNRDRLRSVSSNNLSNIHQKQKSDDGKFAKPFVSMAEQIMHFQRDTPVRFRTKSMNQNKTIRKPLVFQNIATTVPQSPALMTKNRKRTVLVLSQKEIEDLEVEKLKQYQFKASSFNKTILKPRLLPKVEKKSTTQPEPFKLTEIHKKPVKVSPNKTVQFVARPLSTIIFDKVTGVKDIEKKPLTEPVSPKIHYKKCVQMMPISDVSLKDKNAVLMEINAGHGGIASMWNNQKTHVQPFSFEQRDKELLRKKQKNIEKVFEEEKKAREFYANPVPAWIKTEKDKYLNDSKAKSVSNSSVSTLDENVDTNNTVFKARPPTVLYKEPFKPVLSKHANTKVVDFHLSTDKRAEERKIKGEIKKKQQEHEEILKHQYEELLREREEKEIAELRKAAVPKANPIRKFKALHINHSVKKLTSPKSPKLSSWVNKTTVKD